MRKFLITMMCIIMVVCFMPTVAMAREGEEKVAKIGNIEYATLQEAVNAAEEGGVITLLSDVNLDSAVKLKNLLQLMVQKKEAVQRMEKAAIQYLLLITPAAEYSIVMVKMALLQIMLQ